MPEEKLYIGAKLIRAYREDKETDPGTEVMGYHVIYPDGYHSWSPKSVFEEAYREVSDKEKEMF